MNRGSGLKRNILVIWESPETSDFFLILVYIKVSNIYSANRYFPQ